MKIDNIKIENFRSFDNQTIVFDNYNCFIGTNGSGKSTVLNALNLFFKEFKDVQTDLSKLTVDDFHHKNTNQDICITITFKDLSDEARSDFKEYVRQDKLIVIAKAIFDNIKQIAEVKQYGIRMVFDEFREFFEKEKQGMPVSDLKSLYSNYRIHFSDLPDANTKQAMIDSIRTYENNHSEQCVAVQSEDQFYGWSKGTNKLKKYIQWIFIPASKDISDESIEAKDTALGQLLSRTIRSKVNFSDRISKLRTATQTEYQTILDSEQNILDSISDSISLKLKEWAHPEINAKIEWKQDQEKSVKIEEPLAHIKVDERGFASELNRFGHGLQRSYMLAILQELVSIADDEGPTLIMGIEEPEIYQHPPQIRHLADTLTKLSNQSAQILVCTHSPLFIPGESFDKIRLIRTTGTPIHSNVTMLTYRELSQVLESSGESRSQEVGLVAKLYPELNPQLNEMFFCRFLILVEGIEDLSYIFSYIHLMEKYNEFRQLGCHIVPVGGKSHLIKPIAIASLLNIPIFVIFDADTHTNNPDNIIKHKKDNILILNLLNKSEIDNWPESDIMVDNITIWSKEITDVIISEFGQSYSELKAAVETQYDQIGNLNKNPLAITKLLELAWMKNIKSQSLQKVVNNILDIAKQKS